MDMWENHMKSIHNTHGVLPPKPLPIDRIRQMRKDGLIGVKRKNTKTPEIIKPEISENSETITVHEEVINKIVPETDLGDVSRSARTPSPVTVVDPSKVYGAGGYTRAVQCHDCREQVYDLKSHRKLCKSGHRGKGKNDSSNPKKGGTGRPDDHKDCYYLVDVSGSMSGNPLRNAKDAAVKMVHDMDQLDRMAVITFDSSPHWKLQPRPAEQVVRQNELPTLFGSRMRAGGCTAIYDAIYMAVSQLRNKSIPTTMIVLTDGHDNSSSHSYDEVLVLVGANPQVKLCIIHVDGSGVEHKPYKDLCATRGDYEVIVETMIVTTVITKFIKYYKN